MTKGLFASFVVLLVLFMAPNALIKHDLSVVPTTEITSSGSNTSSATQPQSTVTSPSTNQTQTAAATSDVTSNWAGYMATGGTYTAVSGTWTVPSVSESDDAVAADATWIGIGGVSSEDLIQIGTQDVVEGSQTTTSAFYEGLPASSQTISSITVNTGDVVSASIKEISSGEWTISLNDLTNGESFSQTVYYDSSESSAEWIEEAPSDQAGVMSLDDFGSINFTNASTVKNGQTDTIATSGAAAVSMENQAGEPLVDVSTASSNSFTVSRTDATSYDASSAYSYIPNGLGGYGGGGSGYGFYPGGYPHFHHL